MMPLASSKCFLAKSWVSSSVFNRISACGVMLSGLSSIDLPYNKSVSSLSSLPNISLAGLHLVDSWTAVRYAIMSMGRYVSQSDDHPQRWRVVLPVFCSIIQPFHPIVDNRVWCIFLHSQ